MTSGAEIERRPALGAAVTTAVTATLVLAACQQTPTPDPINLRPEVNLVALPDVGTAPLEVELLANATDPEGAPLTYRWLIEGESFEGGPVQRHTFETPGEYTVELTVSDGDFDSFDEALILVLDEDEPGL